MKGRELRALTLAIFGLAVAWALLEIIASGSVAAYVILGPLLAVAVIAAIAARRFGRVSWERSSTAILGVVYFGNRVAFLGVDPLTMSAFLALLLFLTVLFRFDRAFGEVYRTIRGDAPLLREVDRALRHGLARALGAIGVALVLTLAVANLVIVGVTPFTTPLSALILTLLLILIVARLVRNPSATRGSPR